MPIHQIKVILIAINIATTNATCISICSHTLRNTEVISQQINTNLKAILELKVTINQLLKLSTSPSPPNPPSIPPSPIIPPSPPNLPPVPPFYPPSSPPILTFNNISQILIFNNISQILLNTLLTLIVIGIIIAITLGSYTILRIYMCYQIFNNTYDQKPSSMAEYFVNRNQSSQNDII